METVNLVVCEAVLAQYAITVSLWLAEAAQCVLPVGLEDDVLWLQGLELEYPIYLASALVLEGACELALLRRLVDLGLEQVRVLVILVDFFLELNFKRLMYWCLLLESLYNIKPLNLVRYKLLKALVI